jgi:hypothetical protein
MLTTSHLERLDNMNELYQLFLYHCLLVTPTCQVDISVFYVLADFSFQAAV